MLDRCTNKKNKRYHRYGGRGISVCDEWQDFWIFYKDMGEPPEGMSIERKDNDACYSKSNCKWATPQEQARNRKASTPWFDPDREKYEVRLRSGDERHYIGRFDTLNEAIAAKKVAEAEIWGRCQHEI
jgi:hypothetical protein